MKLKTLLLGSAAAMIAVSGARAADAVIAEPEPVDYVKVCDMYGAGFFYIPGTETCLKINGYVDVQYEYTSRNNIGPNLGNNLLIGGFPGSPIVSGMARASIGEPVYLARVNFDAREETDWGTLQSYIRLEGSGGNGGGAGITALDVYISLGGFSTGYRTVATETGGLPGLMLDGYYGGGRHYYADYTYAANGFSATAGFSLDDGSALSNAGLLVNATAGPGFPTAGANFPWAANSLFALLTGNAGAGSKSVDPYVVASYTGSMWTVRGKYHYDTSSENSWYGVDGSVTPLDGFTIRGWYEAATGITEYASAINACGNLGLGNTGSITNAANGLAAGCTPASRLNLYTDNTWGVGASWAVLDNVSLAVGYSQATLLDGYQRGINALVLAGTLPAGTIASIDEDVQSYAVGVDWNPVDNLVVRMNYRRQEWGPSETDEFRIRLRRSF